MSDALDAVYELTGGTPEPAEEAATEAAPVEEAQAEIADDAADVVESAQDEEAPEGESDTEPAEAAEETEKPEEEAPADEDKPSKLYADKFASVDELESGFRESQRGIESLSQQLQQTQHSLQLMQAQAILAQANAVPSRPPALEDLSPEAQQRYEQEAARAQVPAELLIRQDWLAQQKEAAQAQQQAKAYLENVQRQQESACSVLWDYAVKTYQGEGLIREVASEAPEFFTVLNHLPPEAIERFGRKMLDTFAENKRLKAEASAKTDAIRKAVRQESKEIRTSKRTGSEAGRANAAPPVVAPPAPKKATPQNNVEALLAAHGL